MSIRIGIVGYGNLGRGVECAIAQNPDMELVAVKELLGLTGYIRGGCSPIGMKKRFPTYFHSTAIDHDRIYVSAGVRGLQIEISPEDLIDFVSATVADVAS